MSSEIKDLVAVLIDETANVADRDDAAMDLHAYDDAAGLLIEFCRRLDLPEIVAASCAESLATIWKRTEDMDIASIETFSPAAKSEIEDAFYNVRRAQ